LSHGELVPERVAAGPAHRRAPPPPRTAEHARLGRALGFTTRPLRPSRSGISLEALFVEENDPHVNPLGVKGLGEIALVGTAPAIANAVFHATGQRVREFPIRIESLLSTGTAS